MPIGRLLTYNSTKGYGFITLGNNEKDVFVHATELAKAGIKISANMNLADLMLEYSIGLGKHNKKQALNIKVIDNKITNINIPSKKTMLNKTTV